MGRVYAVIAPCELTQEEKRSLEMEHGGVSLPSGGRLPSRLDIEAALATNPAWQTECRGGADGWSVIVRDDRGRLASLRVSDYSGDRERAHSFHFDTGDPELVLDVTSAVARRCGPFVLADEGGTFVVLLREDGSRHSLG